MYLSARYWLPKHSLLQSHMPWLFVHNNVIQGKQETWNSLVWERPLLGKTLWSVVFSPDGQTLTCAASDGAIYSWHTLSGLPSGPPLRGHSRQVKSLAYSRDGRLMASGSDDCSGSKLAVTVLNYFPTIHSLTDPVPAAVCTGRCRPNGIPVSAGTPTYSNACTMKVQIRSSSISIASLIALVPAWMLRIWSRWW